MTYFGQVVRKTTAQSINPCSTAHHHVLSWVL